jgi:ADP-ribose pyrophosphatase YjhB (NUDIX family)
MAHIHEKIDYAADAYIVNEKAVLLRMHDKYKSWFPPGGHVELDEGAVREAKEEVGLDITLVGDIAASGDSEETEILVPRFINRHRINDTHEHISFVYFATADTRDVQQGEAEISDAIKWFNEDDLDDPAYEIKERVKLYAKAALKAVAS